MNLVDGGHPLSHFPMKACNPTSQNLAGAPLVGCALGENILTYSPTLLTFREVLEPEKKRTRGVQRVQDTGSEYKAGIWTHIPHPLLHRGG